MMGKKYKKLNVEKAGTKFDDLLNKTKSMSNKKKFVGSGQLSEQEIKKLLKMLNS